MFLSRDEEGRPWFDLEKTEEHGALDLIQAVKFVEKANVSGKVDRMEVKEVKDEVQGIEAFYETVYTYDQMREAYANIQKWEEENFGDIKEDDVAIY